MPGAFDDRPVIHAVQAAGPDQAEVAAFLRGVGDASAVGRGHHHVAGGQPLRRLRAGFPPLDVRLEFSEFGECPVHALRGAEYCVDVFGFHAVREQGELQVVHRAFTQSALAGGFLHVPEVCPGGRGLGQFVGVVGNRHAPHQCGGTALLCRFGDQLVGVTQAGPVQALVHAFLAAAHQVGAFDLHHVPVDVAGVDHHFDLGHLAVVFALDHLALIHGGEGLKERHVLGFLSGSAVSDHHHVRCCLSAAQAHGHGQHQGIKTVLERVRFHQGFLLQVLPGQRPAQPFLLL
ncbi:hypothetical protein D9M71_283060 [compost metagenome]